MTAPLRVGWLSTTLLLAALSGQDTRAEAPSSAIHDQKTSVATFAGGCFWCMQGPFDELSGVVSTKVGYSGGHKSRPTYEEVSAGSTGHAEAVLVTYDPRKISYAELLEVFWRNIDPTVRDRQFCDVGSSYRSAIFTHGAEQHRLADQSLARLEASRRLPRPVVTEIVRATEFWPAEEYHQDYYRKNPIRYRYYRSRCGRDERLQELWGTAPGVSHSHK